MARSVPRRRGLFVSTCRSSVIDGSFLLAVRPLTILRDQWLARCPAAFGSWCPHSDLPWSMAFSHSCRRGLLLCPRSDLVCPRCGHLCPLSDLLVCPWLFMSAFRSSVLIFRDQGPSSVFRLLLNPCINLPNWSVSTGVGDFTVSTGQGA